MNNWIEISEANLAANFHLLERAAQAGLEERVELLAVIKANAYGHGAERCAPILAGAGAAWLGVTSAREGLAVRSALEAAGFSASAAPAILIMCGFLPADVPALCAARLTPVLWTVEQVEWLAAAGLAADLSIHLEIDTGMGRQGVLPGAALELLLDHLARTSLRLDGLFTHFASSEVADSPLTRLQQQRFTDAVRQTQARGLAPTWIHAGNSSTLDNPVSAGSSGAPHAWLAALARAGNARPMLRSGLALYGYTLPIEGHASPHVGPGLEPVLTWKASLLATSDLATGETTGYNATFVARAPMRIALVPAGYADGLRRELSSSNLPGHERDGGWVMIHGQRAPILGRVSMNLTVVDITHIAGVEAGDEALLLGPGITADDHARLAHTIPYEILCNLHPCA